MVEEPTPRAITRAPRPALRPFVSVVRVADEPGAVAHARARFPTVDDVGAVVEETGYSHRRFIGLFRAAVGLAPKLYCRVLRFQDALRLLAGQPSASLVDVALAAGYSDQPHLNREFRELAGVSPVEYRAARPVSLLHVPLGRGQFRPRSAARVDL